MVIGKRAVVIGAGVGGLAAAQALVGSFEQIVLIERDVLPTQADARAGVPQGRHPHGLLPGCVEALDTLFDGFSTKLCDAGAKVSDFGQKLLLEFSAQAAPPERRLGIPVIKCSRGLIEWVARRELQPQKSIAILDGRRVTGMVATPDGNAVAAVRYETQAGAQETIAADLVIDASGRGEPTLDFLRATGRAAPEETAMRIDMNYSTAIVEFAPQNRPAYDVLRTMPAPPGNTRQGLLLIREDDRFFAAFGARGNDAPPSEWPELLEFSKALQTTTIYDVLMHAKPYGKIYRHKFPENRRRYFERYTGWPRGLIALGDAICRFNPVYGQGMAAAAKEALLLRDLLSSRKSAAQPLDGLFEALMKAASPVLDNIWMLAAMPDLAFRETHGVRPENFDEAMKFNAMMQRAACVDADIHKLVVEVMSLLKPGSALKEEHVVEKIKRLATQFDAAKDSLEA
ncbi:FAD-dependent monooxygenase [Paraburkholderia edwinii]|uniref:FAD-dependent monooxygenase n=1 Tax=Paraburkholderia edwinii TaxID=2861782 RepID=A0ABX8USL5_9BURK|nr:FAD-dependent monooxygenase [Paraburkholderia edwinii]QYD71611.1 FAD-dependent monooxygenase [Paraburkholderia edwinii]